MEADRGLERGGRGRPIGGSIGAAALLALCAAASGVVPARAQSFPPVGAWRYGRMATVLEKTILRVDVLRLEVCFDSATSAGLAGVAEAGRVEGARGDTAALAALGGGWAAATIEFVRDVTLGQFLDGIEEDQRKAVRAGFLADSTHERIRRSLPEWFGFLAARGIRDGDRIRYGLAPDSIRTRYESADGTVLLDRWDAGRSSRNSVLATWLAPGSSFRSGLLRSLGRASAPRGAACAVPPDVPG